MSSEIPRVTVHHGHFGGSARSKSPTIRIQYLTLLAARVYWILDLAGCITLPEIYS